MGASKPSTTNDLKTYVALFLSNNFSLGEQLRRAALSIPTNIAEGSGRDNPKESGYFYRISKGSVYECVSLLVMIGKRGYLERDAYQQHRTDADELAAMLTGLMRCSTS